MRFSSAVLSAGMLQRKCACGQHTGGGGEQCEECKKKPMSLQRQFDGSSGPVVAPLMVHDALRSPGEPLDAETRAFMESRFGYDFSRVRVHTDSKAAASARSIRSRAYTVGRNVVFADGQYHPEEREGRHLLAHELAHVLQQGNREVAIRARAPVERLRSGTYRVAVGEEVRQESAALEQQAESEADRVLGLGHQQETQANSRIQNSAHTAIQRVRVPLPSPVPLCGRTLTHIDVEPPRALPLQPCLPPTVMVTRINIVGRDLTAPTPGRGPQVFNLHVGFFRDPATGKLCGIADDSKTCIAPRCLLLGCFPTLQEVLDAILAFLKGALIAIGVILLAIIIAIILGLLEGIPVPAEGAPGMQPIPSVAGKETVPSAAPAETV